VLAQTTQLIFPVESVSASVEVKTRLYSDSIDDCQKKKAALQKLQPALKNPDGSSHPLFIVLAYDTGISPETVHRRFSQNARDERPDLYCVLDQGRSEDEERYCAVAPSHSEAGSLCLGKSSKGAVSGSRNQFRKAPPPRWCSSTGARTHCS
jgi:hypothetical protein